MLALSFTFPAGRYHATPWDRHVNEGAVAWPPEPWRFLRALIATWHHKLKQTGKFSESELSDLLISMSKALPHYNLPPASHSHTRHYMPQFQIGKTSLVFDAFTAIKPDTPLFMIWPDLELSGEQLNLLDELINVVGYLGRSESWIEIKRINSAPEPNCKPDENVLDIATGELLGESVILYAPHTSEEYQSIRRHFLTDKETAKKLKATLPEDFLSALSLDTSELRKQGWNQPPAARKVSYLRPVNALKPIRTVKRTVLPKATTVQFILSGKPLPRVEDSIRIGELVRIAVMSRAKKQFGDKNIPSIFTGHDMSSNNSHDHAFYLPWDKNNDGHIDRIFIHIPISMDTDQQRVLEKIQRIWSRGGAEWRLILEDIGNTNIGGSLTKTSTEWQSVTPYLHPWFQKKNFAIEDQIKKECRLRGLPEPAGFERLESIQIKGRERKPIHFHRFRSKRGLTQPDTQGSFWRLTFAKPIAGPLALGFGCHYGLGMFSSCNGL